MRFVRAGPATLTDPHVEGCVISEVPTAPDSGQFGSEVEISRTGSGRGAWLCRQVSAAEIPVANPSCLAAATKRHAFAKALRVKQ